MQRTPTVLVATQPYSPCISLARCTCCGSVYGRAEWDALPSRRSWAEFDLEIAECACGSTISVEVAT